MELFLQYTKAVRSEADYRYGREPEVAKRVQILEPILADLALVEQRVDELFARSHQVDVPRSLLRAVGRELKALGISDREPVLTIGRPGNYETFIADLSDFLFAPLSLSTPTRRTSAVTIVSLPYIEGTRALWLPVAVGHEVAHVAVHTRDLLGTLHTDAWLDEPAMTKIRELPSWLDTNLLALLPEMQNILAKWVTEVLCDLYAVYRFGPAGVAAQTEFLAGVGAANIELETHPPGVFRAAVMCETLQSLSGAPEDLVAAWKLWSDEATTAVRPDWVKVLIDVIDAHLGEIRTAASSLVPAPYDVMSRMTSVEYLRDRFAHHVPGAEQVNGEIVSDADILNAGWLARQNLNAEPDHKKRERLGEVLDALVGKAIDTLDFVSMWSKCGGYTPGRKAMRAASSDETESHGGVLPASEITRRLAKCQTPRLGDIAHPLLITPVLGKPSSGTGIDVRLSRTFITFKRSGTASFDVLDSRQDPREIQEVVEKDWGGSFILHPGELVLAATLEYLVVPGDLTAQVITRSSYGRLGLLSATAVQVHPHFKGCLTLELVNLGQMPLTLTPGQRVAQLVFSTVDPPALPGEQKYEYPIGPQFSKVRDDPDVKTLKRLRDLTARH